MKNPMSGVPVLLLFVLTFAYSAVTAAEMTVNLGGRIQVDAAFYDEDVTELGSGTEFRRARLFAAGDIADNWDYKLQLDFADGSLDKKDVFVQYTQLST